MTARRPVPPAPGPLEGYAAAFDDLFGSLAQRRGFREYLCGLLAPRDRNKTLTALAGAEPVAGAQHACTGRKLGHARDLALRLRLDRPCAINLNTFRNRAS